MSETDAEFVDRLVGRVKDGDIGYVLVVSSREEQTRLLSLARRGAESADTITALRAEIEKLLAALNLYREAVRIDVTMEGPRFMGLNGSALKRAWDADRATLEGKQ